MRHRNMSVSGVGWVMALIGVSFVLAPVSLVHAGQPAPESPQSPEKLYSFITVDEMKNIMTSEGYQVAKNDNGNLEWKIEGLKTYILFSGDGKSLQFYTSFKDPNTPFTKINEWNRSKRFSRTYLDAKGDPCLELDLNLDGGVTRSNLLNFLKICRMSFVGWCMEVVK